MPEGVTSMSTFSSVYRFEIEVVHVLSSCMVFTVIVVPTED